MPRIARIVGPGYPHHIVQRGNNREKIFWDSRDYEKYLSLVSKYSEEKGATVLAYCLMPNHAHLLIIPPEEETLAKLMQGITLCYTQYFNGKSGRTGRLWECRYHSTVIDRDRYLWAVCRYIERNPVRAGFVAKPEDYPYSSARTHIMGRQTPLLRESPFDKGELSEYRHFLKIMDNREFLEEIRKQTRLGRPLGEGGFLQTLSRELNCRLVIRPRGRPRKGSK